MTNDIRIKSLVGDGKWRKSITFRFDLPYSKTIAGKTVTGLKDNLQNTLNIYDDLYARLNKDGGISLLDDLRLRPFLINAVNQLKQIETIEFQQASRYILNDIIEPVVDVKFTESKKGKLKFGLDPEHSSAYERNRDVYFGKDFVSLYRPLNSNSNALEDLRQWIEEDANFNEFVPGKWEYDTIIHEVLHALGLKHPGNYNGVTKTGKPPFLPYSLDNNTNTVMSYNTPGSYASTPMPYDILALQHLYGGKLYNTGNTTYQFSTVHSHSNGLYADRGNPSIETKLTIWDSGGKDTFDLSQLASRSAGYYVYLGEGGIVTTQDALNSLEYQPRDNENDTSSIKHKTTAYGTSIAFGVQIENAIGSSSNDKISGNQVGNKLEGGDGNDTIWGYGGNDRLYGDGGSDNLYGGSGSDRLYGGNNNDYLYGDADSSLTSFGDDYLSGGDGSDYLYGRRGNDTLEGGSGNDRLDGGAGGDAMYGGDGNDIFIVNSFRDGVVEYANQGTDYVFSSINYSLGSHVENLVLEDSIYAVSGVGNNLKNSIRGNKFTNTLSGLGGHDNLRGGGGNDILYGGTGDDVLVGDSGNDVLVGNSGADKFRFNSINEGIDNITDFVKAQGDKIEILASGFGGGLTQGLLSASQFVLGSMAIDSSDRFIYNQNTGSLAFDVDGSGGQSAVQFATLSKGLNLASTDFEIVGNPASKVLVGGSGDDIIEGGAGGDRLVGEDGNDIIRGGDGYDDIDGGLGLDVIDGGAGNDVVRFGQEESRVIVNLADGTATLRATDGTLYIENLISIERASGTRFNDIFIGDDGINVFSGGEGDDTLVGGAGGDRLVGGDGDDLIVGNLGNDYLTGGSGADKFRFNSAQEGFNRITDFSQTEGDKIEISASGFGGGLVKGSLDASQFVLGSVSTNASDRFIYNQSTGSLAFDVDGSGGQSAVQFANLSKGLNLESTDFVIV